MSYFKNVVRDCRNGGFTAPCEVCQEDRLFLSMKCIECGHVRIRTKALMPRKERVNKVNKWLSTVAKDKRAYYAKKAAESRAKFEGQNKPEAT